MKVKILGALLALLCLGCNTSGQQKASYYEWTHQKPRYTIYVTWDCDSLPDTLKVAVPK